jgi:two-component system, OmpR family, alkaline phosphatase synthesis response regulator PhoP
VDHGTILIVDDDIDIQSIIRLDLESSNFKVIASTDGTEGLRLALTEAPDLVILDVNLPSLDGLSVCREIRSKSPVPILMLSSLQQDYDKIVGLEVGADDYLGKPFNPRELLARVRALMRRFQRAEGIETGQEAASTDILRSGEIKLNSSTHDAWCGERELHLTPIEFALLETMLQHSGQVMSRQKLLDRVWGHDFVGTERTVDTHVRNLRLKMGEHARAIESVRGVGFKLV